MTKISGECDWKPVGRIPKAIKEAWVKEQVKAIFYYHGVRWFMPGNCGFGKSGGPDFTGCYAGYYIGLETKKADGVLRALQKDRLVEIAKAGGVACVVDENGLADLHEALYFSNFYKLRGKLTYFRGEGK